MLRDLGALQARLVLYLLVAELVDRYIDFIELHDASDGSFFGT